MLSVKEDVGSINDIPLSEPIRTAALGRSYATTTNGQQWTRSRQGEWKLASGAVPLLCVADPPLQLLLILEHQSEGEPKHWSFFLAREGYKGYMFQVTGNAEKMRYANAEDVALLTSPSLAEAILIKDDVTEQQEETIRACFAQVPPPSAESARDVRRNCQTWCIVVMKRLVGQGGLLLQGKVDEAMAKLELVRGRAPVID